MDNTLVWKDRKRPLFGLPLSFTKYSASEEKLWIETGIFSKHEDEIRLYRILDITLERPFFQRICGVGTIHCCSADKSLPEFNIKMIKKPKFVRDMLSDMIEEQREKKRVTSREFMDSDNEFDDSEHDD